MGGDIRIAVQRRLRELVGDGADSGCIFGEDWSKTDETTWRLLQAQSEVKSDADLGRGNKAITVVLLSFAPSGGPGRHAQVARSDFVVSTPGAARAFRRWTAEAAVPTSSTELQRGDRLGSACRGRVGNNGSASEITGHWHGRRFRLRLESRVNPRLNRPHRDHGQRHVRAPIRHSNAALPEAWGLAENQSQLADQKRAKIFSGATNLIHIQTPAIKIIAATAVAAT